MADKRRLINSLKKSFQNENIDSTVEVEAVIKYFAIHNFLCNDDRNTETMVHNYYLYEKEGVLLMIPWDYNFAFGGFKSESSTKTVNSPIDSSVVEGDVKDWSMVSWIFEDDEYIELYHDYYEEFIEEWFDNGALTREIALVQEFISPYVDKDPTKFCTYDEFEKAVDTL